MKRKKNSQNDVYVLFTQKQWEDIKELYHLSPRELQVAKLVCQGLTDNEIAKKLKIAYGTVKTYLRNIYRSARVKNKISMLLKFAGDVDILKKRK